MRKLVFITILLLLSGCSPAIREPSIHQILFTPSAVGSSPIQLTIPAWEVTITPTNEFPADEVATIPTPSSLDQPTPDLGCWEQRIDDLYESYGVPFVIQEDINETLWVLYQRALVKVNGHNQTSYEFADMLECETCVATGTMAVTPSGEIWMGFSDGLVRLNGSQWQHIPLNAVLPEGQNRLGLRVLMSTPYGTVWVSDYEGNVCSYHGKWRCFRPITEDRYDEIISAVSESDSHFWFGSKFGRIIEYQDGVRHTYSLHTLFPGLYGRKVGALAFDQSSGTLWAIETNPRRSFEGEAYPNIGVIKKTKDGKWSVFEKSLFDKLPTNQCGWPLTSMAIDSRGRLWLGMIFCYGVVYYDGTDWKTLSGKALPFRADAIEDKFPLTDDYIISLYRSQDGGLFVLNRAGVFQCKNIP